MNEALIIEKRNDIMPQVYAAIEAFTDDLRRKVGGQDFRLTCHIDSKNPDILILSWDWSYIDKANQKSFRLSVLDTAEAFINKIKAYLFDLAVMIANMA